MSDFKDKAKGLYAEAWEELATLEGVDAMDPLEPEPKDADTDTDTEETQEPPQ